MSGDIQTLPPPYVAGAVAISGGTINGATVGATTPASGKFTTLQATGLFTGTGIELASRTFTTASTNATNADFLIVGDATAQAQTVNLPAAATVPGVVLNVKKKDVSANTVTIQANGAENIDGANTKVISAQFTNVQLQSDGTQWWIL
jgi:hypothetical protein